MKKEVNKILIVIGLLVSILGLILSPFMDMFLVDATISLISLGLIVLLGGTFVFAKNNIVKNIGYGLCALSIVQASPFFFYSGTMGLMLYGIGTVVMFVGALLYVIVLTLQYLGFVKTDSCKATETSDILLTLSKYKDLTKENILTEEEFNEIKLSLLSNTNNKAKSIDDLKKWKKAVDQEVITQDEYANIKTNILSK